MQWMKYCCYTVNDKTYMFTVYWDLSQCRENFAVLRLTMMKQLFRIFIGMLPFVLWKHQFSVEYFLQWPSVVMLVSVKVATA